MGRPRIAPQYVKAKRRERVGARVKQTIPERVDFQVLDAGGRIARARQHVVPLQDLVQHNPIEETAEAQTKENAGRRWKAALICGCVTHKLLPHKDTLFDMRLEPAISTVVPASRQPFGLTVTFSEELLACLPKLRAFAIAMGGSKPAADDLVQGTVLRALASQHRFEPGTNLRAWLFTIMRNLHTSDLRQNSLRRFQQLDEVPEHLTQAPPTQLAAIEMQELRKALNSVPVSQREALLLVTMMGCSYDEAASISNCAVGTIKSRINRAKEHLAQTLGGSYAQSRSMPRSATRPKVEGQPIRVLIAEDEFAIATEYERMLNGLGAVPVGKAPSASQVLRLARSSKPDLILMDVRLNGPMDGIAAAIKVRASVDTRIVFVTGSDDATVRTRIAEFNGSRPLSKPLSIQALASAIADASRRT
jgi:RNA polymerase sigma-70 factor (ECF subfamily)